MFGPSPLRRKLSAALADLSSAKAAVRESAARDLGSLREELSPASPQRADAIAALTRLLDADDHAAVRAAAAITLADLEAHEAASALLLAVEDVHSHVRQMALSALGEIGAQGALPRIERALADERPELRYQATIAFFRLCDDDRQRFDAFAKAITDEDESIRYIALRLAEEHLLESAHRAAIADLSVGLLDDRAADVVLAAAILLGHAGDTRAATILRRVVRHGDVGRQGDLAPEDECEALELAGRLDLRDIIPDLERRAFGVRRWFRDTGSLSAKVALARMGDARAIEALSKALRGAADTRTLATIAAGRTARPELRDALEANRERLDADLLREALERLEREIER